MTKVPFTKMQGAGNDFVMVDNRKGLLPAERKAAFVQHVCPRATAIGADGVILLESDEEYDFSWHFFNADGSEAEMCGNGARCMAVFAKKAGAAGDTMTFRTIAGPIQASLVEGGACVRLTDASPFETFPAIPLKSGDRTIHFINTGVPHTICPVEDLETIPLQELGAEIRYHSHFAPSGTNVNFIQPDGTNQIAVRTYERGVEGETLACGTGSVASAIVATTAFGMKSPVRVRTRSGDILTVAFQIGEDAIQEIDLQGPAVEVYQGTICIDFL